MYIEKINIKSFGPIEELSLKFNSKGLNIVFGDHGTGKSQIVAGIIGAITPHPEIFIKSNNDATVTSEFNISFIENDQTENIIISKPNKTNDNFNVKKNNSGKISEKIYRVAKDDKMPSLLFKRNGYIFDKNMVLSILQEMPLKGESEKLWNTIRNMVTEGINSPIPGAWPYVIEYINEFNFRRNSSVSIPLIIDSPNWWNDESFLLIVDILNEIAKYNQVILFLNSGLQDLVDENQIVNIIPNKITSKKHYLCGESDEELIWQNLNKVSGSLAKTLAPIKKLDAT